MRIGLLAEACPARLDRRSPPREIRRQMRPDLSESSIVEPALAYAERKGFRLAVIGRICALVAIAAFYLTALRYPNTIYVPALLLAIAAVGLAPLGVVGSRYERVGRYALFAFDAVACFGATEQRPRHSSKSGLLLQPD